MVRAETLTRGTIGVPPVSVPPEEGDVMRAAIATVVVIGVVAAFPSNTVAAQGSCQPGFTTATINGRHDCLRRGSMCDHTADAQYRHYGFRCTSRGPYAYFLT
jgi:hypothetical protein